MTHTPAELAMIKLIMLNMDPPQHVKFRRIVQRGFTPQRVEENFAAADWDLPEEENRLLNEVSEGQRLVFRKDCPEGYEGGKV